MRDPTSHLRLSGFEDRVRTRTLVLLDLLTRFQAVLRIEESVSTQISTFLLDSAALEKRVRTAAPKMNPNLFTRGSRMFGKLSERRYDHLLARFCSPNEIE